MIIMCITEKNINNLEEDLRRNMDERCRLLEELKGLRIKIDDALNNNDLTNVAEFHERLHKLEADWWGLINEFNEIQFRYGLTFH